MLRTFVRRRRTRRADRVELERLNRAPRDASFLTGNGFASLCGTIRNYGPARRNERGRPDWHFCKTDFLGEFFAESRPHGDFVLVSHNSDHPITEEWLPHLADPALRVWFAANVELEHPKLRPIPLGVANPSWPHGDEDVLRRLRDSPPPRTRLFDVSFSPETNPGERSSCVEHTGLEPEPRLPFPEYAARLASAYFCISPRGHGLDTHRTWEALYLGTVPVVTRSAVTDAHPDLPAIVLREWSDS